MAETNVFPPSNQGLFVQAETIDTTSSLCLTSETIAEDPENKERLVNDIIGLEGKEILHNVSTINSQLDSSASTIHNKISDDINLSLRAKKSSNSNNSNGTNLNINGSYNTSNSNINTINGGFGQFHSTASHEIKRSDNRAELFETDIQSELQHDSDGSETFVYGSKSKQQLSDHHQGTRESSDYNDEDEDENEDEHNERGEGIFNNNYMPSVFNTPNDGDFSDLTSLSTVQGGFANHEWPVQRDTNNPFLSSHLNFGGIQQPRFNHRASSIINPHDINEHRFLSHVRRSNNKIANVDSPDPNQRIEIENDPGFQNKALRRIDIKNKIVDVNNSGEVDDDDYNSTDYGDYLRILHNQIQTDDDLSDGINEYPASNNSADTTFKQHSKRQKVNRYPTVKYTPNHSKNHHHQRSYPKNVHSYHQSPTIHHDQPAFPRYSYDGLGINYADEEDANEEEEIENEQQVIPVNHLQIQNNNNYHLGSHDRSVSAKLRKFYQKTFSNSPDESPIRRGHHSRHNSRNRNIIIATKNSPTPSTSRSGSATSFRNYPIMNYQAYGATYYGAEEWYPEPLESPLISLFRNLLMIIGGISVLLLCGFVMGFILAIMQST